MAQGWRRRQLWVLTMIPFVSGRKNRHIEKVLRSHEKEVRGYTELLIVRVRALLSSMLVLCIEDQLLVENDLEFHAFQKGGLRSRPWGI